MGTDYATEYLARLTVQRLAGLNKTRAKVESLERTANRYTDYETERRKLDILTQMSSHYQSLAPQLKDSSIYISELKSYLQSVHDSDLMDDSVLQTLTTEHCIGFAMRMIDLMANSAQLEFKGSFSVLELACSTLSMFSTRPSAVPILVKSGAVATMTKVLSPIFPSIMVMNIANAVGNMADDVNIRLTFRANGGVGALVRLLRSDVEKSAQTAAAAALSLLGAHDMVIQDSVRYLGGIELLVALLASDDSYLAEASRCCLISLRRGNVKNQTEMITSIRASSVLARNIHKLEAASELLRFENGTPSKSYSYTAASPVQSLLANMEHTTLRPKTADSHWIMRCLGPFLPCPKLGHDWNLDMESSPLVAIESELLRKKHLSRFSSEEVFLLLEEMGFDPFDLRGFRVSRVNGADLIDMTEREMAVEMALPHSKVRKLQALRAGVRLFDRIAILPRQGSISEVELRLYLAGQRASTTNINKVLKLFHTLVKTDRYAFMNFWDFVTSYDWLSQALRIYDISC